MIKNAERPNAIEMLAEVKAGNAHYFASSAGNWKTGTDAYEVLGKVRKSDENALRHDLAVAIGTSAVLYYVPVPIDYPYSIVSYEPTIDDAILLVKIDYSDSLVRISKRKESRKSA